MSKNYRYRLLNLLIAFFLCWLVIIPINIGLTTKIRAEEVLKVGTEPTFPPFEMQSQNGQGLEGFDIDLFEAIGEEAGFTIQFESLPFDGLIPALQAGKVDAAISGMTITAERAQTVEFSSPYFQSGLALAVRKDNDTIQSFDDLADKKVAVQIGTTGAEEAQKISGAEIVTFDSVALSLQELSNGGVDAVVNDAPVTLYAIKTGNLKNLEVASELLTEEYYGIALPKTSPNVDKVNNALNILINNGTYREIYQNWFAGEPAELPLAPPALEGEKTTAFNYQRLFINLFLGALVTIMLTAFSVFFGTIGGTFLALARLSFYTPLHWLSRVYIDFFRGTPLLVQIFMIYFGLPSLFRQLGFDFNFERLPAAITALSLNSSAYLAEIIRGGIQSIDQGQWEGSQSLGLSPVQTMRYIIFPQAFRRMLPPLGNEFITMLKDTSLIAVIGFEELFRQGQLMVATTYRAFEIYAAVALVYLVLTFISSRVFAWLEKWMNPLNRSQKKKNLDVHVHQKSIVNS